MLELVGDHSQAALWPGGGKPSLGPPEMPHPQLKALCTVSQLARPRYSGSGHERDNLRLCATTYETHVAPQQPFGP